MIPALPSAAYRKSVLPNGLRVLTSAMPHTYSVAISVYVGAGSRYETAPESGVSHFVEHMLFKGTSTRPSPQLISEAIDSVGGVLNAATDREFTVYYAKVARRHLDLALDVLVDLVRRPLFDPEELEKERKVVLEELASVADSPGQQVDLLLDELLWPEQPLGWDVAGSKESIEGLTREMTLDYMGRQYLPSNMVVSIAGNVDHDEVTDLVASKFAGASAGAPGAWFPARNGQDAPRCSVLYKRTEQSHIAMAVRGLPLEHPDRYAIDLLSVLFGEGMSSRLFVELRERRGLCYDVHAYVSHFLDAGSFGVYAAVDPSRGRDAVAALVSELIKLRDGIPEEELHKAKELSKGRLLLRMEDTRAVSAWLGSQEMLTRHVLTPEEVVARIDAVAPEDISRVVDTILVRNHLNLAIVGPHKSEKRFLSLLDL
ncbi:MAG TPA: pitrilysin family protein [Dehalococcoidia bacterium]|nr:pitrilysin family protein [Dehalococcoidia bacterium]